ncbi:hypothetical protein TNCV_2375241 [Trichonephila clavipes]|nr:hypothetical protein TNCV_2375241 [Trichonephila clavipes]
MSGLSDFQTGQIVGTRLTRASLAEAYQLLGVSRGAVSKVLSAYTQHGSAKQNRGRKEKLIERDRRVLKRM